MTRQAIIALLALLATPANANIDPTETPVTVIWRDDGGTVGDYASAVMAAQHSGQRVEIAWECASACTMWLAAACVRPTARLGFHGATAATRADAYLANLYMAGFYPPALQEWYLRGPAKGQRLQWIDGLGAVAMGAKKCR